LFRDYYSRAPNNTADERRKAFFTDKMPFNEVNLPLLKMIFRRPNIHAVRHPWMCVCHHVEQHDSRFACGYDRGLTHHLAVFSLSRSTIEAPGAGDFLMK